MSVVCVCCVLSGRGLCGGVITHPEESYQLWCHCGYKVKLYLCFTRRRSQWPRALESWVCGHSLAGFVVLNLARGVNVCCLCVLSGRGLCGGVITHPEESYQLWCA